MTLPLVGSPPGDIEYSTGGFTLRAEILAVGTELLMGQIANTNAQYISSKFPNVGVGVYYHSVVGDNPERLAQSLKLALERCDVVITTGGLGPTQDDLTKETIAEAFGRKLVLHEESLENIKAHFVKIGRKMAVTNEKQAYMPENSIILKNNNGTAPGCIIEDGNKVVVMLPGPPSEMKPMFDDFVLPFFKKKTGFTIESKFLKVFGIGESEMESRIMDLVDKQTNPTIATYVKEGEVTIRLSAQVKEGEDAGKLMEPVIEEIRKKAGECLYSEDNETLDIVCANLLLERNVTLATAESCTGGLVSETLTNIPGISRIFMGGVVSYSNEAKMNFLGVKETTLQQYGAVSCETAAEMAEGIKARMKTDLGISITGIAGPDGGTPEKPVGLVYLGLATPSGTFTKELRLSGNRGRVRSISAYNAFDIIRRFLLGLQIQ